MVGSMRRRATRWQPSGGITATDRVRSVCMAASAGAMVLVPTLGPVLLGTEEGAEDLDTEITPPDYAFAVWAPIFACVAASTVQHAVTPATSLNRRTGWWLTAAYAANAAWSVAAQSGRFRWTPIILPAAAGLAGVAYGRAQTARPRGAERLVAQSTGLLLGWTGVASVVNVLATRRSTLAPTTPGGRTVARVAVAGAAAGLSAVVAASRQGRTAVAVAGVWALATGAANRDRTDGTRWISAAGAALVASTAAARIRTAHRGEGGGRVR